MKCNRITVITCTITAIILGCIALWLFTPGGLRRAPPLSGQTLDGHMLELAQLRGRPVLVVFWATTCSSCIEEMPHLIELYREFNPKGLEIIGVAMGYDPPEQVRNLVKQQKIPFPIMLDTQENIALKFDNIQLTPTSVLISPDGQIRRYLVGLLDMAKLRDRIQEML